jgi:prophage regulatory protein
MQTQFLRVKQVADTLGMSVPTVWRKAKTDPQFPKPVKVSVGITGWPSDEIRSYVDTLISSQRGAA